MFTTVTLTNGDIIVFGHEMRNIFIGVYLLKPREHYGERTLHLQIPSLHNPNNRDRRDRVPVPCGISKKK